MASLTANEEQIAGGMQVYKISGEVYVNVSALYERGPRPAFANYYHYDVDAANELRKSTARGAQLQRDLLVDVDLCLRQNNDYCKMYMRSNEVLQNAMHAREDEGRAEQPLIRMRMVDVSEAAASEKGNVHPGRLNLAATGQVIGVFDGGEEGAPPRSTLSWNMGVPPEYSSSAPTPTLESGCMPSAIPNAAAIWAAVLHTEYSCSERGTERTKRRKAIYPHGEACSGGEGA
ncbi:unnamed protein product [Toxocara canis]|uniref:LOB domain-containing protein n=1 Tax=Toxocara canis TaxID=6265 RepID=A0A183U7W8_TOXCA|nr:unnamed protein product [Toxocara canis]